MERGRRSTSTGIRSGPVVRTATGPRKYFAAAWCARFVRRTFSLGSSGLDLDGGNRTAIGRAVRLPPARRPALENPVCLGARRRRRTPAAPIAAARYAGAVAERPVDADA